MIDRWIDEDDCCDRECRECEKKQHTIDNAKDFLEGVIQALYSHKPLDVDALDNHLEELCAFLEVNMPKERIQVQRKQSELLKFAYDLTKQYAQTR